MYQPSLVTLQIEETANQTKSQKIDKLFAFLVRGENPSVPG